MCGLLCRCRRFSKLLPSHQGTQQGHPALPTGRRPLMPGCSALLFSDVLARSALLFPYVLRFLSLLLSLALSVALLDARAHRGQMLRMKMQGRRCSLAARRLVADVGGREVKRYLYRSRLMMGAEAEPTTSPRAVHARRFSQACDAHRCAKQRRNCRLGRRFSLLLVGMICLVANVTERLQSRRACSPLPAFATFLLCRSQRSCCVVRPSILAR